MSTYSQHCPVPVSTSVKRYPSGLADVALTIHEHDILDCKRCSEPPVRCQDPKGRCRSRHRARDLPPPTAGKQAPGVHLGLVHVPADR